MAEKTVVNSFLNKLKTFVNKSNNASTVVRLAPNDIIAGSSLQIQRILSLNSGEADLYLVKDLKEDKERVLKLYRRRDAIKAEVIDKLVTLNNPNVAKILATGKIQELPYIVMPYYSKGSLEKYLAKGVRFAVNDLKNLIVPSVIEGLKAIHDLDIIHKDLKPANLMIADEEDHIVLIDFGISSVTNGNTVVVTQTGKSPFYSAPETNTGVFLAESDYYSLGITLYELVTGYTPFQNVEVANLATFAQLQKIQYPEDFDADLKDLIDGLTYKDLSNRNDLANPNRRWGYNEVKNWLNGIKQAVPGRGTSGSNTNSDSGVSALMQRTSQWPFTFNGQKYQGNEAIARAMLSAWEDGKKAVFRGNLTKYYQLTESEHDLKLCDVAEQQATNNNADQELIFLQLMYGLAPTIEELYWHGYSFKNLADLGEQLVKAVEEPKGSPKELIALASDAKFFAALAFYAEHISKGAQGAAVILVQNLVKLQEAKPLEAVRQALRLGYALSGLERFTIAGKVFKNIVAFNIFLKDLYDTNTQQYAEFCFKNGQALIDQQELFTAEQAQEFSKYLPPNKSLLILGTEPKMYFRNVQELITLLDKWWQEDRMIELNSFNINCRVDINKLLPSCAQNDRSALQARLGKIDSCLRVDEYLFKDLNALRAKIAKYSGMVRKRFFKVHKNALAVIIKQQPLQRQKELCKEWEISELYLAEEGAYISFGRYYKNDDKTEEPLEWQVLAMKKDRMLIITRYSIDCKRYHESYENITWQDCTLRKWLNNDFINSAFNEEERDLILEVKNQNHDILNYNTTGVEDTLDKIFLLSIDEVQKYFKDDDARKCRHTPYAKMRGAYSDHGFCWWWLRSPGCNRRQAAIVCSGDRRCGSYFYHGGGVYAYGYYVDSGNGAARAALWLNLAS